MHMPALRMPWLPQLCKLHTLSMGLAAFARVSCTSVCYCFVAASHSAATDVLVSGNFKPMCARQCKGPGCKRQALRT